VNLDLGSGPSVCDPDYVGVDLYHATVQVGPVTKNAWDRQGSTVSVRDSWEQIKPGDIARVDLRQFPWPWPDDSVEFVWSAHFICYQTPTEWISFADELWRILVPGGQARIVWPNLRTGRAWQDPLFLDHVPLERWSYASRRWRQLVGLDERAGYPVADLDITEFSWEGLHDDVVSVATPAQEVSELVEGLLADLRRGVEHEGRLEMAVRRQAEWERLRTGSEILAPNALRPEDAKQQQSAHWWDFAADCVIHLRACCRPGHHAWQERGDARWCATCGTTRNEGEPE
jgi:SAM-dependent methyltransferase